MYLFTISNGEKVGPCNFESREGFWSCAIYILLDHTNNKYNYLKHKQIQLFQTMSNNKIACLIHYNGNIVTDNVFGVFFQNTNTTMLNIQRNSDFARLTEKIEQKFQLQLTSVFYRYPIVNPMDNNVIFNSAKIEDDSDVRSMIQCHSTFGSQHPMELYVSFQEAREVYPTQESQEHQYLQSQNSLQEEQVETQHNEPFFPEEDVGDDSESDDASQLDLFGDGSSDDNIDDQEPTAIPDLYNPPYHLRNVSFENEEPISIFETRDQVDSSGGLKVGMTFESKEVCQHAFHLWHIKNSYDYDVYKSDKKRYLVRCDKEGCKFMCIATIRDESGQWVIGNIGGQHICMSSTIS